MRQRRASGQPSCGTWREWIGAGWGDPNPSTIGSGSRMKSPHPPRGAGPRVRTAHRGPPRRGDGGARPTLRDHAEKVSSTTSAADHPQEPPRPHRRFPRSRAAHFSRRNRPIAAAVKERVSVLRQYCAQAREGKHRVDSEVEDEVGRPPSPVQRPARPWTSCSSAVGMRSNKVRRAPGQAADEGSTGTTSGCWSLAALPARSRGRGCPQPSGHRLPDE
jgi:hypothetical protein